GVGGGAVHAVTQALVAVFRDAVGIGPLVHLDLRDRAAVGELADDEDVAVGLVAGEVARAALVGGHAVDRLLEEPEAEVGVAVVALPVGAEEEGELAAHVV